MKHVKRFLALSLAAALLAGCVSCGNSDEKTSPTGGGSGVDSTGDGGTLRIAMTCAAPRRFVFPGIEKRAIGQQKLQSCPLLQGLCSFCMKSYCFPRVCLKKAFCKMCVISQ